VSITAQAPVLGAASKLPPVLAADGGYRAGGGGDRTDGHHRVVTGNPRTEGVAEWAAAATLLVLETMGVEPSFGAAGTNVFAPRRTKQPGET